MNYPDLIFFKTFVYFPSFCINSLKTGTFYLTFILLDIPYKDYFKANDIFFVDDYFLFYTFEGCKGFFWRGGTFDEFSKELQGFSTF